MFPQTAGYDRAITIFSPDGRLYQVEYAIETVRRGTIAVGIKTGEGIVLGVEERARKLQNPSMSQKVFQVDDHVGVTASGYIPDARVQVDHARLVAQTNRLVYDEVVEVETVAKRIADLSQQFTQFGGVRPFGVALIIGGVDKTGSMIFQTDPSGTYTGYDAVAIGAGSDQVNEFLEQNYRPDLTLQEALSLTVQAVYLVSEDKVGTKHIKLAVIRADERRLRRLEDSEVEAIAADVRSKMQK